jgi:hypothetical protein
MATLGGTQGQPGRTPWGWIIGLVVLAVVVFALIRWMQAGAPPSDVTGQQGVEMRSTPEAQQPGAQPPTQTAPGQTPGQPPR